MTGSRTPLCLGSPVGFEDLERTTRGTLDNVQNYMEYSYRPDVHPRPAGADAGGPEQQRRRPQPVVDPEQPQETGVFEEELLCSAEFAVDRIEVCIGEEIQFTDQSFSGSRPGPGTSGTGPSSRVASTLHRNPVYQYAEAGEFEVYLTVSIPTDRSFHGPCCHHRHDLRHAARRLAGRLRAGRGPWSEDQWEVQTLSGQPWQIRETSGYRALARSMSATAT